MVMAQIDQLRQRDKTNSFAQVFFNIAHSDTLLPTGEASTIESRIACSIVVAVGQLKCKHSRKSR